MENLFGSLAMVFGLATFLIGMSAQVVKQYREKKCGMSIVFSGLGTVTCAIRIVYLSLSGAYWVIPPDVVALTISMVILWQYGRYERRWW